MIYRVMGVNYRREFLHVSALNVESRRDIYRENARDTRKGLFSLPNNLVVSHRAEVTIYSKTIRS